MIEKEKSVEERQNPVKKRAYYSGERVFPLKHSSIRVEDDLVEALDSVTVPSQQQHERYHPTKVISDEISRQHQGHKVCLSAASTRFAAASANCGNVSVEADSAGDEVSALSSMNLPDLVLHPAVKSVEPTIEKVSGIGTPGSSSASSNSIGVSPSDMDDYVSQA